MTKQDLKLAEKDAKKAREHKQKLGEEKEKLKQDIFAEDKKATTRLNTTDYDAHKQMNAEERDANWTMYL